MQRTGWGKSAVYFVATALLRAAGAGPTVIVSPLLALMRNQIDAAGRAGIHAATVNSANTSDWERTYAEVEAGAVDLLLVSPERLNNPDFRDRVLPRLTATAGLLVVDEAHCISDWGHDFRPDYRRLRTLIGQLPAGIPVLATTATANDRVVVDVTEQLGLGPVDAAAADGGGPLVLRGSLDRASLRLSVVSLLTPAQRLGWLAAQLENLPGAGIVYTLTIAAAEEVAEFLRERGYPVASYTGKTDPTERLAAEADLLANRVKALVATSALGMGFDKPDLGFVVHLGAPASPVAYYQQIGRAGRAVERAEVVLLPGREDRDIWAYFASLAFPPEPLVRQTLRVLAAAGAEALSTAAIETRVDLSRTRLEMLLKVLDADGAVRRVARRLARHRRGLGVRRAAAPAHRRGPRGPSSRRCSTTSAPPGAGWLSSAASSTTRTATRMPVAGAATTAPGTVWNTAVDPGTRAAADERLARPGVEVAAPQAVAQRDGRARGAGLGPDRGRRAGRTAVGSSAGCPTSAGAPGCASWSARRTPTSGTDVPVPTDLLDACVRVLAGWGWAERPVGVVGVGSRTRPHQVAHLARRIAEIGRLPLLGTLRPGRGSPGAARQLGATPGRGVARLRPSPDFRCRAGPVLLVDDVIDTGWTATVAARLLRRAGATAVLPFALAQNG